MQATRSGGATLASALTSLLRWPLVVAMLLVVGACGGGSDAPAQIPPVTTGSISGTVMASRTGAALSGVAVTSAGRSTNSAADGTYTLTDVPTFSTTPPIAGPTQWMWRSLPATPRRLPRGAS